MQYDIATLKLTTFNYELDYTIKCLADLFKQVNRDIRFEPHINLVVGDEIYGFKSVGFSSFSDPCYIIGEDDTCVKIDYLSTKSKLQLIQCLELAFKPIVKGLAEIELSTTFYEIITATDKTFDLFYSDFMDKVIVFGLNKSISKIAENFIFELENKIKANLTNTLEKYIYKKHLSAEFIVAATQPLETRTEAMLQFYNKYLSTVTSEYANTMFKDQPNDVLNAMKLNIQSNGTPIYDNPTLTDLATLIIEDEFNLFCNSNANTDWLK